MGERRADVGPPGATPEHNQHNRTAMNLLSPFIKLALPTLLRQGIAAASGYFAINCTSVSGLIMAAVSFLIPTAWSYFTHASLTDEQKGFVAQIARALASQGVAALSGALASHGFTGNPDDTLAVAVFAANAAHSISMKPPVTK